MAPTIYDVDVFIKYNSARETVQEILSLKYIRLGYVATLLTARYRYPRLDPNCSQYPLSEPPTECYVHQNRHVALRHTERSYHDQATMETFHR